MPLRVKIASGEWRDVIAIRVKTASSQWREVIAGRVKTASAQWRDWWTGSGISIDQRVTLRPINESINPTTKLITLQGTNYRWNPSGVTLAYKFQKSTDNINFTDISGSGGTATNPAVGSSNTYTHALGSSDVVKNAINYYRFVVTATYNTTSLSSSSESSPPTNLFQSPTNITLSKGTVGSTTFNLSWTTSTGANRYYIYRSTDNSNFTFIAGTNDTTYTATGLSSGITYYFYVVPVTGTDNTNAGYSGNASNTVFGTTLQTLATPILTNKVETSTGFYFTISNHDVNNTYVLSTSLGSISISGSVVTVSGLTSGQSATATVYATRSGYVDSASASITGTAVTQYTVTWNANGGTVSPTSQTVNSGTTVTAPTPTRTGGYTFSNWRYPLSGGDPIELTAGQSYVVTGNITFYAIWTDPPKLATPTLIEKINTSTGFYFTIGNYDANNTYVLSTTLGSISRSGTLVTVSGLTSGQSATASVYATRTNYTQSDTATISGTAVTSYTITWNGNGGTPASQTTGPFAAGTTHTAPTTPTRSGYSFLYWRDSASGDYVYQVSAGGTFTPTSNITFYARWSATTTTTTTASGGGGGGGGTTSTTTTTTSATTTTTSAAATGTTCTSLDVSLGLCSSQGCDNSGCASGAGCSNPINRQGVDC